MNRTYSIAVVIGSSLVVGSVVGYVLTGYGAQGGGTNVPELTESTADLSYTAATEVGFEPEPEPRPEYRLGQGGWYTLNELQTWQRPPGPVRVGVQIGHLDNDEVPTELSGLTRNGAGAVAAGYNERDTMVPIVTRVAELLESEGVTVDVLPATVPPGYEADVFVSVHADGNPNTSVRGFKITGPRRDYSGRSQALVDALYETYATATNLPTDPNISRRMTAYYAFNWARYEHAVHPFTPAAIVETGFLTNPTDRTFLLNEVERAAEGIATGILAFLAEDVAPSPPPLSLTAPLFPLVSTVECATVRTERRNRLARPCEAALTTDAGVQYLLVSDPPLSTSTLPYRARVSGEYMPVQMLDNYFWFHWEVLGLVGVTDLTKLESGVINEN